MGWSPGAVAAQPDLWVPADNGLIAAAFDPATLSNTSAPVSGTPLLVALAIRAATTISRVWMNIGSAGVTPTANQNFVGLYSVAGTIATLVGASAAGAADGIVTQTGPQSVALAAAQAVSPGTYLAAILFNAATTPALSRSPGSVAPGNANLATAALRFFTNGTLRTSLAASLDLTASVAAINWWAALS